MKSPFKTLLCNALALLFALLAGIGAPALNNTRLKYLDSMINEHGPMLYIAMFFLFRNIVAYSMVKFRGAYPPSFHREFLVYAFFPLLIGLAGRISFLGSRFSDEARFLIGAADVQMLYLTWEAIYFAFLSALSFPLGHILGGLLSFVFYVHLLALPKKSMKRT